MSYRNIIWIIPSSCTLRLKYNVHIWASFVCNLFRTAVRDINLRGKCRCFYNINCCQRKRAVMVHAVEQRMRKDVMSRKRKLFRRLQRLRNKFIEYVKLHVTFSLEKQQFFVFALKYILTTTCTQINRYWHFTVNDESFQFNVSL